MNFSNTYINLDPSFYERTFPAPVSNPNILLWNKSLAKKLNISTEICESNSIKADYFSGNKLLKGSEPIALAYAGHQFGHFVPQLGDGRAHLLGEIFDTEKNRFDVQLKGSGPTRFSRNGDGRCALGPAIREYVMSEAMFHLGIPTTRCLSVVSTGDFVYRPHAKEGAIVTRIASSHIRIGSFQYFAYKKDLKSLKMLADYTIDRHYPEIKTTTSLKYVELIDSFINKLIHLITEWMRVGFIHGVMNTDNITLSGETIDYGPCAMLGIYNPKTVFSSIDRYGRYAFGNQPEIALWNVTRFAECLIPLIDNNEQISVERVQPLIYGFQERYEISFYTMMCKKLGISILDENTEKFIDLFLDTMQKNKLDYTITFDLLTKSLKEQNKIEKQLGSIYSEWKKRIHNGSYDGMKKTNPVVIPRNHHVENVIEHCENTAKTDRIEEFLFVLKSPYKENKYTKNYQDEAIDNDIGYKTFCGT